MTGWSHDAIACPNQLQACLGARRTTEQSVENVVAPPIAILAMARLLGVDLADRLVTEAANMGQDVQEREHIAAMVWVRNHCGGREAGFYGSADLIERSFAHTKVQIDSLRHIVQVV